MKIPPSRLKGFTIALLAVLYVAACASAGKSASGDADQNFVVRFRRNAAAVTRPLPYSAEFVWSEVPLAFRDLGYQGGASTEPGEQLYFTPSMSIRGRLYSDELNSLYLDCGRAPAGGAAADEYSVSFAVLVRVVSNSPVSSTIEVAVDGVARQRAQSADPVVCSGTGRLEQMFANAIEQRVKRSHPTE